MYIDYKVTAWNRINLPSSIKEEDVLAFLENNPEVNSDEIFEHFEGAENSTLFDTEEEISVKDNGGCRTIEVYNDKYNMIWDNVRGKEKF